MTKTKTVTHLAGELANLAGRLTLAAAAALAADETYRQMQAEANAAVFAQLRDRSADHDQAEGEYTLRPTDEILIVATATMPPGQAGSIMLRIPW